MKVGRYVHAGGNRFVADADSDPSAEDILKVRRYECQLNGHSYTEIERWGIGLDMVVCTNCGKKWKVEKSSDAEREAA